MIVRFAIDTDALGMDDTSAPVRRACHERVIKLWTDLGVLVYAGGSKLRDSDLVTAIRELPQDVRKRWQAALKSNRATPGPPSWQGLALVEETADLDGLQQLLQVAYLHEVRGGLLGIADGDAAKMVGAIEIVRFDCADQSETFRKAADLCQSHIAEGEAVSDVWRTRFQALAQHTRNITVVDRYAVKQVADRVWATGPACGHSGLRRLLTELDGVHVGSRGVTCFSAWDGDRDHIRRCVGDVAGLMRRGGLRELRLFMATDRDFGAIAHDRFIRFDNSVCEVGTGLDVLDGQSVRRTSTFTMKRAGSASREIEKRLRGASAEPLVWSFRR